MKRKFKRSWGVKRKCSLLKKGEQKEKIRPEDVDQAEREGSLSLSRTGENPIVGPLAWP